MSGKEIWFRDGNGVERSCDEGSVAHELMSKDGTFMRIDGPGGDAAAAAAAEGAGTNLSKLSKKQLFELAAQNDVPVDEKMTKAELIAAIEAAEEDGE